MKKFSVSVAWLLISLTILTGDALGRGGGAAAAAEAEPVGAAVEAEPGRAAARARPRRAEPLPAVPR